MRRRHITRSSWAVLTKKRARQRRALEKIDAQFEIRARAVPVNKNLFDDPQIKKIMRRRDKILKKG